MMIDRLSMPTDACVAFLGAGPCLDIDLRALCDRFLAVTLVDLDAAVLQAGMAGQGMAGARGLRAIGKADVTGLRDRSGGLPRARPRDWAERLRGFGGVVDPVIAQDGVVSLALLSQLIQHALEHLWQGHPDFPALVEEIRLSHLRYMLRSLRPGGWGIMIADVVASDTLPELCALPPPDRLQGLLDAALAGRNHFLGLDPRQFVPPRGQDAWLDARLAEVSCSSPWVWQDAPGHARLMVALSFRRRA
jgi:hypothetical protein